MALLQKGHVKSFANMAHRFICSETVIKKLNTYIGIMKTSLQKLLALAAVLLGLGLLFSCEKPQPVGPVPGPDPGPVDPKVELAFSVEQLVFSSFGGSQQAKVTTNQADWTVTVSDGAAEWITVTVSGTTVTIAVRENTSGKERSGTVTISAGGKKIDVPVKQEAAAGLPPGGENMSLTYSLAEGTVIAPKALAPYITAIDKGLRTFTVSKNAPKDLLPPVPCNFIVNTPTDVLPGGLLCSIWQMEEGADGYVFYYNNVNFASVFKELNLDTDEIDLAEYVEEIEDAEGNEVPFTKTKAATQKTFHIVLPQAGWDLPAGFSLTPKMTLDLTLKLQMIVGDYKISTLNVKVDTKAEIGADLELMVEANAEKYFKLLSVYFAAIPLGPVVITPSVDIYGVVGVDGKIGLSASASTVLRTSASLHYDEINGVSGEIKAEDPEPGETKYSASPKVEAGFYYGLGIGPALGIYTDIIQTGVTLNVKRREAISTSINFSELAAGPGTWITASFTNAEYSVSWLMNAALHLRAFGMTEDESTPDITLPGETYKMFPPIAKEYELTQDGTGNFTLKAQVTAPSIFPGSQGDDAGDLVLCMVEGNNALATTQVFPFDMDDQKAKALWEDPDTPQTIEATASGLMPGLHAAYIAWRFGDSYIPLVDLKNLLVLDAAHVKAIRGILSDIRSCGAGEWEGCNWDDDTPLSRLEGVGITGSNENADKSVRMHIVLKENWKLGSNLTVKNHSAGIDDLYWELGSRDADRKIDFDTITIEDESFENIDWSWTNIPTKKYVCRSPKCRFAPMTTESFDVSGSGITGLSIFRGENGMWGQGDYPSIILADNCPNLYEVNLVYPEGKSLEQFSARNCPGLMELTLEGAIRFTPETISGQSSSQGDKALFLDCPGTGSVTIGNGWTTASIQHGGAVTASGAKDLRKLTVEKGVTSLSIADCPNLEELYASAVDEKGDLQSFSISGTPKMRSLQIFGHKKLKEQVPAVFDEIRARGGDPEYDIRYGYTWFSEDKGATYYDLGGTWHFYRKVDHGHWAEYHYYHDCGYGFYYPGEPQQGYHIKK